MIELHDVYKTFRSGVVNTTVADGIDFVFPAGRSVGLLGRNGAGKSTMMAMIGGNMRPDAGTIKVHGTISWPVGFRGSFHRDLTGAQNTKLVSRIYGVDTDELLDFVADFSGLGKRLLLPVRSYSSGMMSRLAFAISIGIPFDTYMVDEVTSVGDAAFRKKSSRYFSERLKQSGAIVVSHSVVQLRDICDSGAVLENGKLWWHADLEEAIAHHNDNLGTG